MKLAVFGAGGFVGATLCERLFFEREFEFVPVIHSFSGAGRLARLPLKFTVASVLDEHQLRAALQGCDTIVNCSRGNAVVMRRGMRNLIRAARAANVKRIIHISSIAIYGSNPPPESQSESAAPCPDDPYGMWKKEQDEMLMEAHRSGMGVVLLCPANIYGPYSPFVVGAAAYARQGPLFIVDEGQYATNNVHVNNIAEAVLSALRTDRGWGERYFVNEVERTTWRQFYEDLAAILGVRAKMQFVSRDDVLRAVRASMPVDGRTGFKENLKILGSGEFRQALAVLPAFARLNAWSSRQVGRLGQKQQDWLRDKMARPTIIAKQPADARLDGKFTKEQIKTVYHSPTKAIENLGFRPFSYRQGMQTVEDWLKFTSA